MLEPEYLLQTYIMISQVIVFDQLPVDLPPFKKLKIMSIFSSMQA